MRFLKEVKAFTIMEVVVVIAAISILAGILIPLTLHEIEKAKIESARAEMSNIKEAILAYARDVGFHPANPGNPTPEEIARGAFPRAATANGNFTSILSDDLVVRNPEDPPWNSTLMQGWRGPYISPGRTIVTDADNDGILDTVNEWKVDPWGHYYLYTNTDQNGNPVQDNPGVQRVVTLICAGPDGEPNTLDDNINLIVYWGGIY